MAWLLLLVIVWQPIYLLVMALFHTFQGQSIDQSAYFTALRAWFTQLLTLVFSKPQI
jgi:hypothetical protein